MKPHIIIAFIGVVTVLLFCAATAPMDKRAGKVDWKDVRGAAKHQAIKGVTP